jgi:branched-chain amino acid aminotransferase
VDGSLSLLSEAVVPAHDRGYLTGWTVFETALALDGRIPAMDLHLGRLADSCREAMVPLPEGRLDTIADEMRDVAGRVAGRARVRVTLSGSGLRVVAAEPVSLERFGAPVRAKTGPFAADPFLSGAVKHGSRAGWVTAVQRAGVDEVLLVDAAGRFTEGTTSGILAVIDGVVWTAPSDGRILPSTTVSRLKDLAVAAGIPVVEQGAPAEGPWDALYIASATRGLAPVIELDGVGLAEPDAPLEPIGAALHAGLAESMT